MNILHISIVTYKTNISLIKRCLSSIFLTKICFKITIVDNSPTDDLKKLLVDFNINYLHCPQNLGYGAGHNLAINNSLSCGFKYHLVLNADVYFDGGTLESIISYMDSNPHVGQIMPKILNADGSIQRVCKLVPTPVDLLLRRFIPRFIYSERRQNFELWSSGYDKIMFVPYLSGCFMFLSCNALKDIGVFDERFFMYPEDIDLTRRVALSYDTLYFPRVFVTHDHGAASYKSFRMMLIHAYNIIKYFNKWGWFFDGDRKKLNQKTLFNLMSYKADN